jgi:hypothetical protein
MALFPLRNGRVRTTAPVRRRVIVIEEPEVLAPFLRDLQPRPLCHDPAHVLPVEMRFIGQARSDNGAPVAIWACPTCNHREGWCQDYHTGRPRRLFSKPGNGR